MKESDFIMLNFCVITGRLTADPELRMLDNNTAVLSFSIASQRDYKNKSTNEYPTDFLNVTAWRGTAEFIGKHFRKGSLITVVGRLETRKYTDKDGNNRTAYEIKAEHAYFGDSFNKNNTESDGAVTPSASSAGFVPDFEINMEDEVPFGGGFPAFGE